MLRRSNNHITNTGFIYDAAGDLLWDGGSNYEYDAEGRVKLSIILPGSVSQCPAAGTPGPWQCPLYNALGQRVEDYQGDGQGNPMTLTYPVDIFGQRTGTFAQWPSQNWTGWNVYWSQIAGQRLNMGGASAYIDHSDAVGSTTMETDPAGAVQWDVTHYPWGRVFQETGIRQSEVVMGLDWQVNDPVIPSATREFSFRDYRWMTPDPDNAGAEVGDSQSWDMYSYVGDNPTTNTDPSGLDCIHFSPSPGGITVGVESGACSGSSGMYINGSIDTSTFTYNGSSLDFSYTPYSSDRSVTQVVGFGAPASTSDLSPFTLGALSLAGQWASTGIRDAAVGMALNGELEGINQLVGMGIDALLAARVATRERQAIAAADIGNLSNKIVRQMGTRGWTVQDILDTIQQAREAGGTYSVTNKATGGPATEFVSPSSGRFVVVDDTTREVLQVSGPGFRPNYQAP